MTRHQVFAVALLVVSFLIGGGGRAMGHGAFPATASVNPRRGSTTDLLIGTTFGVLLSRDQGTTWDWVCEEAYHGQLGVPPVLLFAESGVIWAATFGDLTSSTDGGCTWTVHPTFSGRNAADVQAHPSDGTRLYVTTVRFDVENGVYESKNSGETFSPLIERAQRYFTSVRVAASNPSRIYAGTWYYDPYVAAIFRTSNGGMDWQEISLASQVMSGSSVHVVGVHPLKPEVVFVAVGKVNDEHLLRSEDGGDHFTRVLTSGSRIAELSISDDGADMYLSTVGQIHHSSDGGKTWTALAKPMGSVCAAQWGNTLYACGSQFSDGFAIGRSQDRGTTWQKIYNLAEIRGQLGCSAGTTTAQICTPIWPQLQAQLVPMAPVDAGADAFMIPDPDQQDGGTSAPPAKSGCSAADLGVGSRPQGLPGVFIGLALGAVYIRRRRIGARDLFKR